MVQLNGFNLKRARVRGRKRRRKGWKAAMGNKEKMLSLSALRSMRWERRQHSLDWGNWFLRRQPGSDKTRKWRMVPWAPQIIIIGTHHLIPRPAMSQTMVPCHLSQEWESQPWCSPFLNPTSDWSPRPKCFLLSIPTDIFKLKPRWLRQLQKGLLATGLNSPSLISFLQPQQNFPNENLVLPLSYLKLFICLQTVFGWSPSSPIWFNCPSQFSLQELSSFSHPMPFPDTSCSWHTSFPSSKRKGFSSVCLFVFYTSGSFRLPFQWPRTLVCYELGKIPLIYISGPWRKQFSPENLSQSQN